VSVTFRPITAEEVDAFGRSSVAGFGESPEWLQKGQAWHAAELDRTVAGFDGDAIVTTARNYSLELTVPGGSILRAAGLSAVTVLPTHRRRGYLRQMISLMFDDAIAREEPVSMLTASEASIYERFGYGISTRVQHARLDKRDVSFVRPRPGGRFRLLDVDDARKVEPTLFDRVRRNAPGAISRPDEWWSAEQYDPGELGNRFDVLYESEQGTVEGYATYGIKDAWNAMGGAHTLHVRDFVAATPTASHALQRYLCEVDLVATIVFHNLPLDSPLPWLLESSRAVRAESHDYVWTRLLDVPAALGARTYAVPGTLVIAIHDELRPGSAADGTFSIEADGSTGSVTRSDRTPDLECGVAAASAAWLGGVRWSELASAGLVDEHTSGALVTADTMFLSTPLPYPYTWF